MTDAIPNKRHWSLEHEPTKLSAWIIAVLAFSDPLIDSSEELLKRIRNGAMLVFVVVALPMAIISAVLINDYLETRTITITLVAALLGDILLCFIFIVFSVYQFIRLKLKSTISRNVTSPLYLKILRHLTLLSLISAITTASVGVTSIFILGDTIVNQIKEPVEGASKAANSYIDNQYRNQGQSLFIISEQISSAINLSNQVRMGELRKVLQDVHRISNFADNHLFIVDYSGNIVARGLDSYIFDCDRIAVEAINIFDHQIDKDAITIYGNADAICNNTSGVGEAVDIWCIYSQAGVLDKSCDQEEKRVDSIVYRRQGSNKLYGLSLLDGTNLVIYGQRQINAEILSLYIATQVSSSVELISRLGFEMLNSTIVYLMVLGVILLLLLPVSIRIARRVSQPVEELAELVDRVGDSVGSIKIPDFIGGDEIAKLGRSFKDMLRRLENRQNELEHQYKEAESEKSKFNSVLTTVSSGVIGLDSNGCVTFYNHSVKEMLQADFGDGDAVKTLAEAAPRFAEALGDFLLNYDENTRNQKKVTLVRRRDTIELLVRVAKLQHQQSSSHVCKTDQQSLVISVEDVTKLTESERAAFAVDAAKQVAHDLKSPLQAAKISLSNIDFLLPDEHQKSIIEPLNSVEKNLNRVTELVNRFQIPGVLGEVKPEPHNITDIFSQFIADMQSRYTEVSISQSNSLNPELVVKIDKRSMQDVFENLISNAWEAIDDQRKKIESKDIDEQNEYRGKIHIDLYSDEKMIGISVADNGIGLAKDGMHYVTANVSTRGPKRGNGLVIVETIVRKHKGLFSLEDAEVFEGVDHNGAKAVIKLPIYFEEK